MRTTTLMKLTKSRQEIPSSLIESNRVEETYFSNSLIIQFHVPGNRESPISGKTDTRYYTNYEDPRTFHKGLPRHRYKFYDTNFISLYRQGTSPGCQLHSKRNLIQHWDTSSLKMSIFKGRVGETVSAYGGNFKSLPQYILHSQISTKVGNPALKAFKNVVVNKLLVFFRPKTPFLLQKIYEGNEKKNSKLNK